MRAAVIAIGLAAAACGDNTPSPFCLTPTAIGSAPAPFAEQRFVAHEFGAPSGLLQVESYTESREGFEVSYRNGFRALEIDLMQLADGTVAGVHDGHEAEYGIEGRKFTELTRADLAGRKGSGKYEVLFAEDLIQILVDHPDMWLILDTKCCHAAIDRVFVELAPDDSVRDRIVPHVNSQEQADEMASIYPFPELMYARYQWPGSDDNVLARLADNHIQNVMMWWDSAWNDGFQDRADRHGFHVWVHTPREIDVIETFVSKGIGVYSDGYIDCK